MKILLVPMAAMAETAGPMSRTRLLTEAFLRSGIEVALCAAEDFNYKPIKGVYNYHLSVPVPLGLPGWIGKHFFSIIEKSGIMGRKTVHSFEEVLQLTGAVTYPYFKVSVDEIRAAIKEFKPDVVYTEFNLSAIAAAKAEQTAIAATYSYPVQTTFASSPQFAHGVNRVLGELKQAQVVSSLELFKRTDLRFVFSSHDLEPMEDADMVYAGALKKLPMIEKVGKRNKILVYMGNGTISKKRMMKEITNAFKDTAFDVYIACKGVKEESSGNIHKADHYDFSELFPETAVFINHGGQNSIVDGLIYGVPQLLCPGKVFERKYNAGSIVKNEAGILLEETEFKSGKIIQAVNQLTRNEKYHNNALALGHTLASIGGTDKVVNCIIHKFN